MQLGILAIKMDKAAQVSGVIDFVSTARRDDSKIVNFGVLEF